MKLLLFILNREINDGSFGYVVTILKMAENMFSLLGIFCPQFCLPPNMKYHTKTETFRVPNRHPNNVAAIVADNRHTATRVT